MRQTMHHLERCWVILSSIEFSFANRYFTSEWHITQMSRKRFVDVLVVFKISHIDHLICIFGRQKYMARMIINYVQIDYQVHEQTNHLMSTSIPVLRCTTINRSNLMLACCNEILGRAERIILCKTCFLFLKINTQNQFFYKIATFCQWYISSSGNTSTTI